MAQTDQEPLVILDTGEVRSTGRVVDGRVQLAAVSKLAAGFAKALGLRSRLIDTLGAAQQAGDHLKARGFDPKVIDRVMWHITEPFPLSLAAYGERIFKHMPAGIGWLDGQEGRIVSGSKRADLRSWALLNFTSARALTSEWGPHSYGDARGAGDRPLSVAVALGNWRCGFTKDLARAGMDDQEAKRFAAGHELGHAVFRAAGHIERSDRFLEEIGLRERRPGAKKLLASIAEELFADALGSIAARPSNAAQAMALVGVARRRIPFGTIPSPSYMRDEQFRKPVESLLARGTWSSGRGGIDLYAECLAMALGHVANLSPQNARARCLAALDRLGHEKKATPTKGPR